MAERTVTEGKVKLRLVVPRVVSSAMPVFYNPIMHQNRDIALMVIRAMGKKRLRIADPMAGSGIRGLRFLRELPKSVIAHIDMNDSDPRALRAIRRHCSLNKISAGERQVLSLTKLDASSLLQSGTWDYIDIDPFGSPIPFLDAAVQALRSHGILALTATDTAPLAGSAPKACMRKYWAVSRNDAQKHEWGLRILIRKAQLIAAQYERALFPLLSYWNEHYYRLYLEFVPGKTKVDGILSAHTNVHGIGPLWTGRLGDGSFVRKVYKNATEFLDGKSVAGQLSKIYHETKIMQVGFLDAHGIARERKWKMVPSITALVALIRSNNHAAAQTHLAQAGIRTTMGRSQLIALAEEYLNVL